MRNRKRSFMILGIGARSRKLFLKPANLTPIYHLQRVFLDEYGSPDKRVKKFENVTRFRVDVCELANGADGNPLSSVCTILATDKSESEVAVHLDGRPLGVIAESPAPGGENPSRATARTRAEHAANHRRMPNGTSAWCGRTAGVIPPPTRLSRFDRAYSSLGPNPSIRSR